ncbi:hypothetical protein [Pedobacter aquatilis]|uniref:hypothetical protein n=1 Tax=Pedobacter aquatilis TaxID=351343 RepID=UPI0029316B73|nr:hypothetical protein [Pedobacter aquatilis]
MSSLAIFKESIKEIEPATELSVQLKALWFDGKGDWHKAHSLIDHLTDQSSALVHAYLHRKEGDIWNADYWYSRAKSIRPNVSLEAEWAQLVEYFLK